MMVKSKFKIFPIVLISYLSALPLLLIIVCLVSPKLNVILATLVVLSIVVVFWMTILKSRSHSVEMSKDDISVKRYFGLGELVVYKYSKLDGFVTVMESAKGSVYETIFFLQKGKRVGCISSFYHKNFENLKLRLKENLVDLGE